MSSPSVLIVGHGYLGHELAQQLYKKGYTVVAVSRNRDPESAYPVMGADVSNRASLRTIRDALPFPSPDVIVHCASSGGGGVSSYRDVFVQGLEVLTETFTGIPVLFTSSSSVYGQTSGELVVEQSETRPDRETSRILCEAEDLALAGGGIALRLAGIYGPGRSVHLKNILEGTATIDGGEVSRTLNQIHRDDAAGAIAHLIHAGIGHYGGRVFNVVDDCPITQRECYTVLAASFGIPVPPDASANLHRKRAWTNKIVSNAALRATGWTPKYASFLDAVKNDKRLVPSILAEIERAGNG